MASTKSFWSTLGFGDFYYELGVQIIQVCLATREANGGLIDIHDLLAKIERLRGANSQKISEDDVLQSIKRLRPLGSGFKVVQTGNRKLIHSLPQEFNVDSLKVLEFSDKKGFIETDHIIKQLEWSQERLETVLNSLVSDGILWIDDQSSKRSYWLSGSYI